MKTLIINGSPKRNGDTAALLKVLTDNLKGEVKTLSSFSNAHPCNDCRFCRQNEGCAISDEWQEIYPFLEQCDNVVIASPIWFSSLSGVTLNIASRIQTLFSAMHFRGEPLKGKQKQGLIILVGAEKGTEKIPQQTAKTIMKFMNVYRPGIITVCSMDTDNIPAREDTTALKELLSAAQVLNSERE